MYSNGSVFRCFFLLRFILSLEDCVEAEWLKRVSRTRVEFAHELHPGDKKDEEIFISVQQKCVIGTWQSLGVWR